MSQILNLKSTVSRVKTQKLKLKMNSEPMLSELDQSSNQLTAKPGTREKLDQKTNQPINT